MKIIFLDIIKVILIGFFGLFIFIFAILMRNSCLPRYPNTSNPQEFGIQYESVNFETKDNVLLAGWLMIRDSQSPTIIVCHGLGANRSDVLEFAFILYKAGYNIFMFDFRGHGESQGWYTSFGFLEQRDLIGAIEYLKSREEISNSNIGVFGISMSGSIAILVASDYPNIKAIVVDSPYTDLDETIIQHTRYLLNVPGRFLGKLSVLAYRMRFLVDSSKVSPVKAVSKIAPRAIFIINGAKDDRMIPEDAKRLYEAAGQPKQLWLVDSAGHLESYAIARQDYERRLIEFFKEYLSIE